MPLARISVRIEIVGSPAPRKAALIRNSRMTVTLPPSITRVKRLPMRDHLGRRAHRRQQPGRRQRAGHADDDGQADAERDRLHGGARGAVRILLADAARDDGGGAHRQAHRERVDDDQHRFGQRRPWRSRRGPASTTQKMSATANTDSIAISSTIGTASSRIARPSGSDVKSWRAPRSDSRTSRQKPPRLRRGDLGRYGGGGGLGRGHRRAPLASTTNGRPPNRQAATKKLPPDPSP